MCDCFWCARLSVLCNSLAVVWCSSVVALCAIALFANQIGFSTFGVVLDNVSLALCIVRTSIACLCLVKQQNFGQTILCYGCMRWGTCSVWCAVCVERYHARKAYSSNVQFSDFDRQHRTTHTHAGAQIVEHNTHNTII